MLCQQKTEAFTAAPGNPWGVKEGWLAEASSDRIPPTFDRYVALDETDDNGMLREVMHDCQTDCDGVGSSFTDQFDGEVYGTAPVLTEAGGRACCVPTVQEFPCAPLLHCVPVNTQAQCDALGGAYLEGSDCTPDPCGIPVPCVYPPPDCNELWLNQGVCNLFDGECQREVTQFVIKFSGILPCLLPIEGQSNRACFTNFFNNTSNCYGCGDINNSENSRTWFFTPPTFICSSVGNPRADAFLNILRIDNLYTTSLKITWYTPQFNSPRTMFFSAPATLFQKPSCPSVNAILNATWSNEVLQCPPENTGTAGIGGTAQVSLPRFED